jgi:hypothetical protein
MNLRRTARPLPIPKTEVRELTPSAISRILELRARIAQRLTAASGDPVAGARFGAGRKEEP